MSKMNSLVAKVKTMVGNLYKEVTTYWSHPNKEKGEYISYKEFTSFCIGATCSNSIGTLKGYISFAATCFLVGSIYGISFNDIVLIGFITLPFSYIFNPINMLVQDNLGSLSKRLKIVVNIVCISSLLIGTGLMFVPQQYFEQIMPAFPQLIGVNLITSAGLIYYKIAMWRLLHKRFGKFRPFVVAYAVPCLISLCLLVYLPFKDFEYPLRLWLIFALFNLYNNFGGFSDQIGNLSNVISPNSEERGKLMSIGCFIYSSVPSLVAILLPIFATMLGGFTDLNTYQILFPIAFLIFGAGVVFFFGFAIKEKVILNENHKANVNLKTGFKEVLKNKYFWITKLSILGGAITAGSVALNTMLAVYSLRADWMLGIYAGVIGTASIPGLLLAPILMKKFGKKRLMLVSKFAIAITTVLNLLAIAANSFWLVMLFSYIQILMVGPAGVAINAINADIWDFQQWKSGERLDGCSGILDLIIQPFTMLGGMTIPIIYAAMGFTTDWDILYIDGIRNNLMYVTVAVGIVAALLTSVPYFFYDLTDAKMKRYIQEIKEREGFKEDDDGDISAQSAEAAAALAVAGDGGALKDSVGTLYLPDEETQDGASFVEFIDNSGDKDGKKD